MRGPCDKLTQSEIWDIATMREAKVPIEDIAKKLKRHTNTVTNVIRSVMAPEFHPNNKRSKRSPETIEAMRLAWSEGVSASTIADIHGVSRNVVIGLAYRLAFPRSSSVQIEARRHNAKKASATRRGLRLERRVEAPTTMTRRDVVEAFKMEPYVVQPDEPPLIHNILDLEDNHCRWPIGDTEIGFCGKMRATNYHPYCAGHLMRSIRQPPPPPGQPAANDSQPRHRIVEAAE